MTTTKDDEELRQEYLAELPGLLAALSNAVTQAQSSGSADDLRSAVSKAHALKGTSGSYRFIEISDAAGLMEDGLLGIQAGWLPAAQGWPEIERALATALDALKDASK